MYMYERVSGKMIGDMTCWPRVIHTHIHTNNYSFLTTCTCTWYTYIYIYDMYMYKVNNVHR